MVVVVFFADARVCRRRHPAASPGGSGPHLAVRPVSAAGAVSRRFVVVPFAIRKYLREHCEQCKQINDFDCNNSVTEIFLAVSEVLAEILRPLFANTRTALS